MGRNIFQSAFPAAMIQAVSKVVHEDMKPGDALQVYHEIASGPGPHDQ
jgi:3-hydroxy-5-phosphonooxypentane-2,4-dione thiolase